MPTYILYENAVGFTLFRVKQTEIIAAGSKTVQKTILDRHQFQNMVEMVSHLKFETSEQALDSLTCAANGELSSLLEGFLRSHLVGENIQVGIIDKELSRMVHKTLPHVRTNLGEELVLEMTRGIRLHFCHLVKSYKPEDLTAAQLGLGHQYCRTKLHKGVCHEDTMIIQSSSVLEQLDKDINQCAMRIKEWYSWHFPELIKIVPDAKTYSSLVCCIKDRMNLLKKEVVGQVDQILEGNSVLTNQVVEAGLNSMGMDLRENDILQIMKFGTKISRMLEYRENLNKYVGDKMTQVAPNLTALIGENIGSKLIAKAGSLLKLAKCPSSTVQILGAEKALFRALKTRGKTPKYGILYNSSYLGKAQGRDKGRMARFVANKTSLASRMDAFGKNVGGGDGVYGELMKEQLEQRISRMSGQAVDPPMKNRDVMAQAKAKVGEKRQRDPELQQPGKMNLKKRKLDNDVKMGEKQQQQQQQQQGDGEGLEQWILESDIPVKRRDLKKSKNKSKTKIVQIAEGITEEILVEDEKTEKKKKKKKKKKKSEMTKEERKKRKEKRRKKRKERKEKKEKKKKKKKKKKSKE